MAFRDWTDAVFHETLFDIIKRTACPFLLGAFTAYLLMKYVF